MSKGAKIALIIVAIVGGLIVVLGVACAFCAKVGWEQVQNLANTGQSLVAAETGVKTFKQDVGRYPTEVEGLQALLTAPTAPDAAEKWHGPYVDNAEQLKDGWGNPLVYKAPAAEGDRPTIYSMGFNGIDDGGPGAGGDDIGSGNIQVDVEAE